MNERIKVYVVQQTGRKNLLMRYVDPLTGRQVNRSTGTHIRRDAERLAHKWEAELQEGRYAKQSKMYWQDFVDYYDEVKLSSLSERARKTRYMVLSVFTRLCNPKRLGDVTTGMVTAFQKRLRQEGRRETTIASYSGELQAAMNWAEGQGLIGKAPRIEKPRRAKGISGTMRGRAITDTEFDRMLWAVQKIRKQDVEKWKRLLRGLWLSGLRLGEALALSWDPDADLMVNLDGEFPVVRMLAEGHKCHKDLLLPIVPEFANFLLSIPEDERRGLVFGIYGPDGCSPLSTDRASRIIAAIGKRANILTNPTEGNYASAHDLRRSFGTRLAKRVMPATLKALMRHSSIETTMKYYISYDANEVSREVWQNLGIRLGIQEEKSPEWPALENGDDWRKYLFHRDL